MNPVKWALNTLLVFHLFHYSTSIDTITANHSIKDGKVIVSRGKVFVLGFFSPGNSPKRYVGIWYYQVSEKTIVWVANRDDPINGTSGILSINKNGNLVVYETNQSTVPIWSTNVSVTSRNDTVAQILDSGNLVLVEIGTKKILWQSFEYPTHTLLPFMKLRLDRRTGLNRFLSSWKSPDDPGSGNYSCRINQSGFPQLSLYMGSVKWWRTGSWTGQRWSGVPEMAHKYIFNVTFVNNEDEISVMYGVTDPSIISIMVAKESGSMQRYTWSNQDNRWIGFWSAPNEPCDYYGHCGPNSNCNPYHPDEFACTCLPGFEPKYPQEWYLRNGAGGCRKKRSTCQGGEGFIKLARLKVPDTSVTLVDMNLDLKACESKCLKNCSCVAYTSAYSETNGGIGCLTYHGDMLDTRSYANAGQDLYVRVAADELDLYLSKKNVSLEKKVIVAIVIASFFTMLLVIATMTWFFGRKRKERARKGKISLSLMANSTCLDESLIIKKQDLPLLDLRTIVAATNNFSSKNKLGEGGFGSVYKGQLPNGQEIAIKRLSQGSRQGIGELKNEIILIAKLQHRNLVRLLGCCMEKEEMMLIYEFMPNKSLDNFIFDQSRKLSLDWKCRFDIILGIARGILYLHQDSRLRVIHRDLKASNILLNSEMKPKISDFGTAKIFEGDETQGNTRRIVGTYGYMSPKYAFHGLFSTKSDVFSFGVIVLEIISGKKSSSYCHDYPFSHLIQHTWELWRDEKALEVVDSCIADSCPTNEVLKCINIGLLCVQDAARDRPNMSTIVFMLSNETTLPSPKKPTFGIKTNDLKPISETKCSNNEVTMTTLNGR